MKKILLLVLILPFCLPPVYAQDTGTLGANVERLTARIERQIERMERVREKANSKMELSALRIERQLALSESELELQIERLKALLEGVPADSRNCAGSGNCNKSGALSSFTGAFSDLQSQVAATQGLLARLEKLQGNLRRARSNLDSNLDVFDRPSQSQCNNPANNRGARADSSVSSLLLRVDRLQNVASEPGGSDPWHFSDSGTSSGPNSTNFGSGGAGRCPYSR
ncbi:hypothetical protein ACFL2Q_16485 [Thermodesulfobacteriota bacterium]